MWDFGKEYVEESAPTGAVGLTPHEPDIMFALGPAEEVLGNLADCPIDHNAREQVLGEMTVAIESEIGLNEWFRTAVETQRFFKAEDVNISSCVKKTVARLMMFVDPAIQSKGQHWLAEGLVTPLQNAILVYNSFLVIEGHDQKILRPFSGASDSSAAAGSSSVYMPGEPGTPLETPDSVALRELLTQREINIEPVFSPVVSNELGEAEVVRRPRGRTAAATGSGVDTGSCERTWTTPEPDTHKHGYPQMAKTYTEKKGLRDYIYIVQDTCGPVGNILPGEDSTLAKWSRGARQALITATMVFRPTDTGR
eukprot:7037880-Heterocapsa_arctica.AAC.1